MPNYLYIIKAICNKHNISIETYEDERLLCLHKNEQVKYIWSRRFDINSAVSSRIADNKHSTYLVLKKAGIPTIECVLIPRISTNEYKSNPSGNFAILSNLINQYGSIIIKPNNGYEGNDVYKCDSIHEIETVLFNIQHKYKYLIASPFINIKSEYRVFYLAPDCLFTYKKNVPYIISDGETPVNKLIDEYIHQHKYNGYIDDTTKSTDVLPKGTPIKPSWKFNLSQGASPTAVTEPHLKHELFELAQKAGQAISINFASIDIIEDYDGHFKIMEINAGVAMDCFLESYPDAANIAFCIYEKAITNMFDI